MPTRDIFRHIKYVGCYFQCNTCRICHCEKWHAANVDICHNIYDTCHEIIYNSYDIQMTILLYNIFICTWQIINIFHVSTICVMCRHNEQMSCVKKKSFWLTHMIIIIMHNKLIIKYSLII